jgi:hypothetical protein
MSKQAANEAALTVEMTKCGNKLCDDGQTLLCQKPAGHNDSEPHESGNWEWWDFSAAPGKEVMPSETTKGAGEVAELARELYNRFVPSGWDPRYAHGELSAMLKTWASSRTAALRQENERLAREVNKWINHGLKLQADRDALRQRIAELERKA